MASPFQYTPRDLSSDPTYLAQQLAEELRKISSMFKIVVESLPLDELNAAPDKVWDGRMVRADGTNWDPGSGQGAYIYYNSGWNFLG